MGDLTLAVGLNGPHKTDKMPVSDQGSLESMTVFGAILGFFIVFFVASVFYRKPFGKALPEGVKPYSDLPGPPLWPLLGNMPQTMAFLKQDAHAHHKLWTSFADQYGGIYRLHIPGHRFVVVSDPAMLPDIIGRPGLPKWAAYENVIPLVSKSKCYTLFTAPHSDNPMWKAVRKALNPAFSPSAIKSKFGLVVDKCEEMCRLVASLGQHRDVEAQDLMARLTLDIILRAGFGMRASYMSDLEPVPLLQELHYAMDESFRTFSEPVRAILLRLMPWLPAANEREAHFARLYSIWDGWIQHLTAHGPAGDKDDSMWACIMRVRDPATGKPLEGDQLQAEVCSLIVGGLDTTAQTCSFTLALLAAHPQVQGKVAAELEAAGLLATKAQPEGRRLTYADLGRLPYLDAVVRESMRMFPVSASGLGRCTKEPTVLGGYLIPAGCEIQINYYAMQNTAANFEDPQRFWPGRWLRGSRAGTEPRQDWDDLSKLGDERDPLARAFLPYSAGPRNCIGQPLAMMEVPAILAMVIARFSVSLTEQMGGYQGILERQTNAFTLSLKGGCWLRFAARAMTI